MVIRRNISDDVFDLLNQDIISGKYKVGDTLPSQDKLSQEIGVSRNTLREAINRLSMLGIVASKQGVGTIVKSLTGDLSVMRAFDRMNITGSDIFNIIETRLALERTIVRLAAVKAKDQNIQALGDNISEQKRAVALEQRDRFAELDVLFHLLLADASGNHLLRGLQEAYLELFKKFVTSVMAISPLMQKAFIRHYEIFEAIAQHNCTLADHKIVEHLFSVVEHCFPGDSRIELLKQALTIA